MAKEVDVFDCVPPDLQADYVTKRRPLAVRGAASRWPAVGKWTPAYLKETVGHCQIRQATLDNEELEEFSFGEYLELLQEPPDEGAVLPYVRNKFLHQLFPELSPDVGRLDWLPSWLDKEPMATLIRAARPNWLNWAELFVCQANVRYPVLHTDHCRVHAWSAQIYGIKRYWVWPSIPGFKDVNCIGRDLDTFLGIEPSSVDVGPGDVVVIPAGLPHVAESVTTSITISGTCVEESNWEEFSRAFCAMDLLQELTIR